MAHQTIVRYAGRSYLDRTAALQSGEVRPSGARLAVMVTPGAAQACDALLNDEADCAEIPLRSLLDPAIEPEIIALPIFPNRGFCLRLLRAARQVADVSELNGLSIGVAAGEETVGSWVRFTLDAALGPDAATVTWVSGPAQEIVQQLDDGRLEAAVLPGATELAPTVSLLRHADDLDRSVYGRTGIFPILSVVALRKDAYERDRWLAVSLTDAFAEAKALGDRRHRYFGALSVGLPWLMESIRDVDVNFGGDAYRYGIEPNREILSQFATYARASDGAQAADITGRFAPEVASHPGEPETSFYVVPLSHT
jgi:4,5-dihydroxyphthalate decarboxylase